ncbi:unnamed protein product [Paramecium primaurelia]|uniref:Uncharacterized protein n=2 Tax=Paramecium TaxID=5884 RepID=A0A8S1U7M7_9CILI|nr:unnamed protein product [Paramecium primaurelia]CAD8158676.1 unnamed protein product [Paramecium pentaurelia]
MFLKRIASSFSKSHHLVIPYYNKGYQHPIYNELVAGLVKDGLKIKDVDGFIYAFNNVIASINHEDFNEFANKTCDSELVKGFETGLKRLKDNNQFIEPIYDPEIEEEIIISDITFCFELNDDESYYLQKPIFKLEFSQSKLEFYNSLAKMLKDPINQFRIGPKLTLILDCFIKCKTSIKIQNFDLHPYAYHAVKFQAIKQQDQNKNMFGSLIGMSVDQMVLGQNYNWRITNIDNFLKR